MKQTILYVITMTQTYDAEVFEPRVFVFDDKDKAFNYYKELVTFEDGELNKSKYYKDFIYSEDNFEDYKNAECLFEKYSEYNYTNNHFRLELTTKELNSKY